jgi:hypothetical protein
MELARASGTEGITELIGVTIMRSAVAVCGRITLLPVLWMLWIAPPVMAQFLDDRIIGDKTKMQAWYAERNKQWEALLREAGEAKEGLVLEARPKTPSPSSGDECELFISLKNIGDLPFAPGWVSLSPLESVLGSLGDGSEFGQRPEVFIRNSNGEPVELTKEGIDDWRTAFGGGSGFPAELPPGWAWGKEVPVGRHFLLSKPDKYTILVAGRVAGERLVAKPVIVEVGKPSQSTPTNQRADAIATHESALAVVEGRGLEAKWSELAAIANLALWGFQLQAQASPVARKSDHLIVSLYWAGSVNERDQQETARATRLANYRILVRDSGGKDVPLNDRGRVVFADKQKSYSYWGAYPGFASGLVCSLSELFSVKPGQNYKILVVLPGHDSNDIPWVAGPVNVHVPQVEIAGVTRPPYGSPKMWQKLTAMAAAPRADLVLENDVRVEGGSAHLTMRLKRPAKKPPTAKPPASNRLQGLAGELPRSHDDPNASGWEWADQLHLICNSRGVPVMPDENGKRNTVHGGFSYPANYPGEGSYWYPLSAIYPLRPGSRYTVVSAVNLTDHGPQSPRPPARVNALVVATPVQFSMPEGDYGPIPRGVFIGHDDVAAPTPKPKRDPNPEPGKSGFVTPSLTFDQQWELANRFAGKPFDGLLLEGSVGKPTQLRVVLRNRADKDILVKKWKGNSDYEILVRYPAGKPAALTEKGRKFFQSGELLDIRTLKPGEAIETTLPLSELFSVQAHDGYTVLVSLPVLGDVDAVLTAKPVKVTAVPVFFGVMHALSVGEDGGTIFLACWLLSVMVLRAIFGWRVPLLLSAAFGAVSCGLFVYLTGQSRVPSGRVEAIPVAMVIGIVVGAAIAGLGIGIGWLIHQLVRGTSRIRFATRHNKTRGP